MGETEMSKKEKRGLSSAELSNFCGQVALILEAGLPLTRAVAITARVLDNYFMSLEVGKVTARLEEGQTLGKSLRDAGCLPDILVDMTAVGEESGELGQTLQMTAEYYDSELWLQDFEADEAGKLPKDLKRGVLSEDAVYDLITDHEHLLERMEKATLYESTGEETV